MPKRLVTPPDSESDRCPELPAAAAAGVGVLATFAVVVLLKLGHDNPAAAGLLKEEFALQYRYARMVADGSGIPAHDPRLQHPEGVAPFAALPLGMEFLVGAGSRLRSGPGAAFGLSVDAVLIKALWSSLSVLACAAATWVIFRERLPAVAAALLYGLSQASGYRTVPSLPHEDFALPLLFSGVAALLAGISAATRRRQYVTAAIAGLCWGAALLTWHFSRFFLTMQSGLCLILLPFVSIDVRQAWQRTATALLAVLLLFGIASGHLRATAFPVSAPVWILLAVSASAGLLNFVDRRMPGRFAPGRLPTVAAVFAVACVAATAILRTGDPTATYGHVWEFLAARLRHWSGKPDDPQALSFSARILWTGSFHSPGLSEFLYGMWAPLAGAGIALARRLRSGAHLRSLGAPSALLWFETAACCALALMVARLDLLAVFFLSVAAGGALAQRFGPLSRRWYALPAAAAVVLASNYPGARFAEWLRIPPPERQLTSDQRLQPVSQVDHSLLRWAQLETSPDAVFAGRFNILPPLLAYADRPIVLHSKFEIPGIRAKVEDHFRCLFETEDQLADFCDRNRAGWYLHDPMTVLAAGTDSPRYLAGLRHVPRESAAYAMQFAPDRLRRFELVYQNSLYRVYRRTDRPPADDPARFPYQPLFDLALFDPEPAGDHFSDARTAAVLGRLQRANDFLRAAVPLFAAGRWPEAYPYYRQALDIHPSLPYAHSHLARMLLNSDRPEEARQHAESAVRVDPYEPEAWFHRAQVQTAFGDSEGAAESLAQCRRIAPDFPGLSAGSAP